MLRVARPLQVSMLACLIAAALAAPAGAASKFAEAGRSYDARLALSEPARRTAAPAQANALAALRSSVPELRHEIDAATGATRTLSNMTGYLTGPHAGDTQVTALAFLRDNATLLGLTAADLGEYEITDDVASDASPVRHLYLRQMHQGVPVYHGQIQVHIDREGRVLMLNNQFVPNLARSVNALAPTTTAAEAATAVADFLGVAAGEITTTQADTAGPTHRTVMNAPKLSTKPIEAQLMLLPVADGTRLVWHFALWAPTGGDMGEFTVDAATGQVWTKHSWVDEAQYKVYEFPRESPSHTTPLPPADGRTTQASPEGPVASPFGWHDTNGAAGAEFTTTQGNNVHAYTDTTGNNTPDAGSSPDCGAGLNCTFPLDLTQAPSAYRPAAVTNLFYANNMIHDIAYPFGFNEVGGNFQTNNYGRGGLGNDSVQGEAQDGGDTNNARFGTPPDGQRPRMQMYLWTAPTPDRDGDFDNGIIAHEYGHGISNRLVGGPSIVTCLENNQQPGEGLSDWWALYMTHPNDTSPAARIRGIGTYALNQAVTGIGIRQDYYDGDFAVNGEPQENTWTYQNINGAAVPHGVGSRWAQAYWQVTWALIDQHGYDADLDHYTGTAADKGNIRAMYYIIEGLKNTACSPTFTDVRDGIIAAANAAPFNGVDTCRIWRQFAEYGVGVNAVSGGSNSTSPTNGFNIPPSCDYLGAVAPAQKICAGTNAVYALTLGEAYTAPVDLTVTGHPAGTTAVANPDPATAPGSTTVTISNTAGAAPGSYAINVNGTDGTHVFDLPLSLNVFTAAPSAPALSAPAHNALGVSVSPTLTWAAATQVDTYVVEIATDPGFGSIVFTRTVAAATTSAAVTPALNTNTRYYWRVRASNQCAAGGNSSVYTFKTAPALGDCDDAQVASTVITYNVEGAQTGWTTTGSVGASTWALSSARPYAGTQSWLATDVLTATDQRLISPPITLPSGQNPLSLSFQNDINLEERSGGCYDGGMIDVSTNDGANWTQVPSALMNTPYTGALDGGPGNGLQAWCGTIPYRKTVVDLNSYAGQTVRLRFRVSTDGSVGDAPLGWFVDDIKVQSCTTAVLDRVFGDSFE